MKKKIIMAALGFKDSLTKVTRHWRQLWSVVIFSIVLMKTAIQGNCKHWKTSLNIQYMLTNKLHIIFQTNHYKMVAMVTKMNMTPNDTFLF